MGGQELSFGHIKPEMSERLAGGVVKETVIYILAWNSGEILD